MLRHVELPAPMDMMYAGFQRRVKVRSAAGEFILQSDAVSGPCREKHRRCLTMNQLPIG